MGDRDGLVGDRGGRGKRRRTPVQKRRLTDAGTFACHHLQHAARPGRIGGDSDYRASAGPAERPRTCEGLRGHIDYTKDSGRASMKGDLTLSHPMGCIPRDRTNPAAQEGD